ncbi:hypothetical protein GE061_010491 [Apolygus lucorum]|uniref:Uncharacterized protein n=1 Tax=Apolygus lucorum TaxID=248454 RepID=A0A8S9XUR5_APOLU|nr:hypothetical protein GE061_010491 [Apolygus lucorum]
MTNSIVHVTGVVGRPAGDLLAGREFLAVYMRQSRSQVPSYLRENDLVQQPRSAVTRLPSLPPAPSTSLAQEDYTTSSDTNGGLSTTTSNTDGLTTTNPPEDQSTVPPETSQVVAVSVSSSVVRQKPVYSLATQEEPTLTAAVQRSHFSVDEGTLTIHKSEPIATVGSRFTVERSQDGEKTSLVVRQSNGEASSHFSIRQSHAPELAQQSLQHQRQLSQHQQLIDQHRQQVEQHRQQLQQQHEQTVEQHQQAVQRQQEVEIQQVVEAQMESSTLPQVPLSRSENQSPDATTSQFNHQVENEDVRKLEKTEQERVEEDRREERTSFSVASAREEKSFRPYLKRVEVQEGGRQEERTSFSVGAQVDRGQWRYQERVFGEPEKNYEVDESVSVQTNGRAHGVQTPPSPGGAPPVKSGYVVEGQNFRKYRVEEKTPDGFIVGEYGVVSHDDGSLRGVRYTADSNINPRLIYDALVKFLSLK